MFHNDDAGCYGRVDEDDLEVKLLGSKEGRKSSSRCFSISSAASIIPGAVLFSLLLVTTAATYYAYYVAANPNIINISSLVAVETGASFDFYIFSMIYQPGFCYNKDTTVWAGCTHTDKEWTKELTIHGLWPDYNDGTWPQFCSSEKFDPSVIADLEDQMKILWPDDYNSPSNPFSKTAFYEHEWSKHGTCSGLTQEVYFKTTLASYVTPTPSTYIGDNYGSVVDAQDLILAFGGVDIAFPQCKGKFLEEVRFCLGRDKGDGKPTGPTHCPEGIKQEMEKDLCKGMVTLDKFE
jgi:ribonuclease T2